MPMVCTGGKLPAADVVAAVEKGVGVIDRATRRRDIASEGRGAIETFRALCPPRGDGKDVDVEVARALFAFAVVCGAVQVMRMTNPTAPRPFRVPLGPVIPVLGVLTCLLLMLSLPAANWARLLGWMAFGLLIYFTYGRRHSVLGRRAA